ncbi:MAG: ABC transporter substrate-binding protein [Chloroflexi bacterium]|nr:ABC transporter substrate-binding protein [Chloroflexota bacterium]
MWKRLIPVALALALLALGCGPAAAPSPAPPLAATRASDPWSQVPQIVDPANHGWPRSVRSVTGPVELKRKPERILVLSLGHEEMSLALVPPSRLVGTSQWTINAALSNVVELARAIPVLPSSAEAYIAARPELVVVTPYTRRELIQQLTDAGMPVFLTEVTETPLYYERDLLLLAYLLGEEERALEVMRTVQGRRQRIERALATKPAGERPTVLSLSGQNFTGGSGTSNESIIAAAGGVNAATKAGVEGWHQISLEAIAQMDPDYVLLSTDDPANPELPAQLFAHPAFTGLRAFKERERRIINIPSRYLSTLSFWNIRGIEELARALWPQDFAGVEFRDFDFRRE